MFSIRYLSRVALVWAFMQPLVCWAQQTPKSEFSEEDKLAAEARKFFDIGEAAFKAGNHREALDAFERSMNLRESYDTAGNLGLIEIELREYPRAANHLAYCLRHFPTGENRELKKLVEENLAKAKQYVAEVTFEVNEPKATVSVDGEVIGVSPFEHTVFVRAGHHIASAQLGEREVETPFTIERGRSGVVTLEFPKVLPSSGLDGPEASNRVTHDESTATKRNWVPAYILGGATVATFATSMVFRGMAGGKAKDVDRATSSEDSRCSNSGDAACASLDSLIKKHDSYVDVSNVTLIASGVFAAATIGYVTYALTKKPQKSSVQATLGLDRSGGSVLVLGRF